MTIDNGDDEVIRSRSLISHCSATYDAKIDTERIWCNFSLVEVILDEQMVYLIFEYLSMDLKKRIDKIPYGELMNRAEVGAIIFDQSLYCWSHRLLFFLNE